MPTDFWINVKSGPLNAQTVVLSQSLTTPHNLRAGGDRMATDIIKLAMTRTLEWFVQEYMPLRFSNAARYVLGYKVAAKTEAKKRRMAGKTDSNGRNIALDANLPNVWTGDTREAALKARSVTSAVGGATSGTITSRVVIAHHVPQGRNLVTNMCVTKVTPFEAKRIAEVFKAAVDAIAATVVVVSRTTRAGTVKTRASMADVDKVAMQSIAAGSRSRSKAPIARTA